MHKKPESNLREGNPNFFNTLRALYVGGGADERRLTEYADKVSILLLEFEKRFADFRGLKDELYLFALPCTSEVHNAPLDLQLPLNGR